MFYFYFLIIKTEFIINFDECSSVIHLQNIINEIKVLSVRYLSLLTFCSSFIPCKIYLSLVHCYIKIQ